MVLSPALYNRRSGLAVVVPITSKAKGYPFEVLLPAGLPVAGVILADHLKSVDWVARTAEYRGTLPADTVREVLAKAALLLTAG